MVATEAVMQKAQNPLACAVDGKIYVFGGVWHGPFHGEVYDPAEDKWDSLPPLADLWGYRPLSPMNVVLDDPKEANNKLILVHIRETKPLYAYNVRRGIWETFDGEFGFLDSVKEFRTSPLYGMGPTNVVVDNFLYCYSTGRGFLAYDLYGKKWHPLNGKVWHHIHGILEKESDGFRNYMNPALFHLGGNTLCFLWSYGVFCGVLPDVSPDDIVGCAKFKLDDKSSERESSLRSLAYFRHADHACGPLHYVLL
ncbi:Kelch repeat type 1 [Corchorus olitorius]|uniref:Kelch repeat type 1 n=1 Tax=Corchorus olitorius TaxID=93759 RepID=A0A1R3L437_9ROSI|nr:Kelch repeat type 1 [Corchorus olitorius]